MLEEVKQGRFREDLYYRLNVFPLHIEMLKNRKEDIVPLAKRIVIKAAKSMGVAIPELTSQACQKLQDYIWQGNVRELDNVMQRATILHKNNKITEDDIYFPQQMENIKNIPVTSYSEIEPVRSDEESSVKDLTGLSESNAESEAKNDAAESLNGGLRSHEWDLILKAINETQGSRKDTAEKLGISQRTLRYKLARMRKEGVEIPSVATVK